MKMRRAKYDPALPRLMYTYFSEYSAAVGAPSFTKFARSIGVTLRELNSFRKRRKFDTAWHECNEIRRDYLIDQALSKRFDASFTKFIYTAEFGDENKGDSDMNITVEVLGEQGGEA